ncbi:hypothetical protein MJ581_19750 [Escherichia coli]|nr:hypothetical protein MJ581_19750 [Escherichia coli]
MFVLLYVPCISVMGCYRP